MLVQYALTKSFSMARMADDVLPMLLLINSLRLGIMSRFLGYNSLHTKLDNTVQTSNTKITQPMLNMTFDNDKGKSR